jgi:hypothetical protein
MKMKGMNKEHLRKTILQEPREKPSKTPRRNYLDPNCKDKKNKDKEFT